jgi:hypothetical protein
MDQKLIETARTVSSMLEHLSADSVWAHRASGMRGSLLRILEHMETGRPSPHDVGELDRLVQAGFDILEKAAREIRAK